MKGDSAKGYAVIKELREKANTRKRDEKALMKTAAEGKKEDKTQAKISLWEEIKDRYLGVLIRQQVPPKVWVNAEFPVSDQDNEVVLKMLIEGKNELMNRYYKNACDLMSPEP